MSRAGNVFFISFSLIFLLLYFCLGEISYSILMTWAGIFFMLYASSQVLIMMTAASAEESRSVSLVSLVFSKRQ